MRISMEELRAKAAKFNSLIRWRNVREYVAALIIIVWAGIGLWKVTDTVERIAFALMMAGCDLLHVASLEMGFRHVCCPRIWDVRIASGFIKANSHGSAIWWAASGSGLSDRYSPEWLCSTHT